MSLFPNAITFHTMYCMKELPPSVVADVVGVIAGMILIIIFGTRF